MLIEVFDNQDELQTFANAVQEPIEYYESEQCGRLYVDIQSNGQWGRVAEQIRDLSYRFRLVVHDRGIDGLGPSPFCRPGVRFNAFYRVVVENGSYRILDEGWDCAEVGEGGLFTFYRVKDGMEHALPLVKESPDADDYDSMLVYQCGDDLSVTPDNHNIPYTPNPTAPQFRLILPEDEPLVDWPHEGF
ncbi:MAG: hypothetical protein ABSG67_13070 [Thermoguttaceae bacterium]|jgi:hypothetical protein